VATEVAALKAAGFRTRVDGVAYWGDGPQVTTTPEIGAPARVGSVVTVHKGVALPAVAGLGGMLVESGGPAPGAPRPVSGWVHVQGGPIDEYVYTKAHGRWSLPAVPGGTAYTITGAFSTRSDGRVDESCRAAHEVTPQIEQFGASDHIEVVCSVD